MHELDYGSFEIRSHGGAGSEAAWVEIRANCICGAEIRATGRSFVLAKGEVEARFAEHVWDVRKSGGE